MVKGVNFGLQMVDFAVMVQSQIGEERGDEVSGSLAAIGTVLVSKVGVELIDTFLDLSEHFLFEG